MRIPYLERQNIPRDPVLDKHLRAGIAIYYVSKEHGGLVEEAPDGTIRRVRGFENDEVVYEDEPCPSHEGSADRRVRRHYLS